MRIAASSDRRRGARSRRRRSSAAGSGRSAARPSIALGRRRRRGARPQHQVDLGAAERAERRRHLDEPRRAARSAGVSTRTRVEAPRRDASTFVPRGSTTHQRSASRRASRRATSCAGGLVGGGDRRQRRRSCRRRPGRRTPASAAPAPPPARPAAAAPARCGPGSAAGAGVANGIALTSTASTTSAARSSPSPARTIPSHQPARGSAGASISGSVGLQRPAEHFGERLRLPDQPLHGRRREPLSSCGVVPHNGVRHGDRLATAPLRRERSSAGAVLAAGGAGEGRGRPHRPQDPLLR